MEKEGQVTATEKAGGTQPDAQASKVASYTDEDMARARIAFEKQAEKRVSKAAQQAAQEAKAALLAQLGLESEDDLTEYTAKISQTAGVEDKAKAQERQLKKFQTDLEKLQSENQKLRSGIQQGALERSVLAFAEKHNGHANSVLAHVAYDRKMRADDDGRVFVVGDDGQEDATVSAEDYIKKILGENKHLLRGGVTQGAGSRPSGGQQQKATNGKPATQREAIADAIRNSGIPINTLLGRR